MDEPSDEKVLVSVNKGNRGHDADNIVLDLHWIRNVCRSATSFDNEKEEQFSWTMARSFDNFQTFGVIQLLRESIIVLRMNSSFFWWILTVFLAPLSAVILCQVLVTGPTVKQLEWQMKESIPNWSFLANPFYNTAFLKISENVVANAFLSPFVLTLLLLSKACISFKVACIYAGHQPLFQSFVGAVCKLYKRLVLTYLWICLCTLGSLTIFALSLAVVSAFLHLFRFSADIVFLVSGVVSIIFCVFFAHLLVICNLANVVSVLDDKCGSSAIIRAFFLIKGRTQVALLLLLLSTTMAALVDGLFQYRVIGRPGYYYSKDISRIWEAPLLVLMYSFLSLCDSVTSTIFYFTCKVFSHENLADSPRPAL